MLSFVCRLGKPDVHSGTAELVARRTRSTLDTQKVMQVQNLEDLFALALHWMKKDFPLLRTHFLHSESHSKYVSGRYLKELSPGSPLWKYPSWRNSLQCSVLRSALRVQGAHRSYPRE